MASVRRTSRGPCVQLEAAEIWLMSQLLGELEALLRSDDGPGGSGADAAPAPSSASSASSASEEIDPLAALTGMTDVHWPGAAPVEAPEDPALRRLLPDAYRDDAEAAAEFRRFTEGALRDGKRTDAAVVAEAVAGLRERSKLTLDDLAAQAWLRVLADLRLVLATRLGIETESDDDALEELPEDDPRRAVAAVYYWLGAVLTELLEAIG